MSRVGKLPVSVPQGVKVDVSKTRLVVEGPKGKLEQDFIPEVAFTVDGDSIAVTRKNESKKAKSLHGLYRNLLNNMIIGVTKGYAKELQINGVGYRAELSGTNLILNLGFSTQIEFVAPEGVSITTDGPNKLTVSGIDKALVGKTAAEIRSLRPPEPYKGKGIKYADEVIRRKVGKAGVK